jgi:PPOX class probable F420-dependent enzyme
MSFVMSAEERETFLSEPHVGVFAIERPGRAPLAVPVWYDYRPGGEVLVWIDRDSVKHRLLGRVGRFSLAVHSDQQPYRYVTAEGPVVAMDTPPTRDQAERIVGRYLPGDQAKDYIDGALGDGSVLVRMRPEKWLSNDQGKAA